ncbi:MAG TPA: MFS transporter [Methylomirabilota bacterium]|jgi:AGZA family xanthine/uracil permease-like MFS transporter|nr:MFS transporter [Methylomirabilota bacterium]
MSVLPGGDHPTDRPAGGGAARPAGTSDRWYSGGDVNATFGLVVDNMTNLVVLAGLLIGVFQFPADLVLYRIVPGTAIGVLVGDLVYTWLALRLARETGRADVTAMPFGIDTPSMFGITFGVVGPVMVLTKDPVLAWKVGMGTTVAMGVAKLILSFAGEWVRRTVPRAGLLGSIAGVAILLIAFLPALKVFADPLVGLVSLGLILVTFVGGIPLPGRVPGALAAVVAGGLVAAAERGLGMGGLAPALAPSSEWRLAIPWPTVAWLDALPETWSALPVALPFALATIIGGIDNTESAIAAGDHYRTRDILLTEAIATILAGACGGVIQNTPYIGHPAYKAMGARAAYTLATGLVIGLGAMTGVISLLVGVVPEAAVAPILIFIGLEITAQAFLATPPRHAAAVAFAFVPVIAALLLIELGSVLGNLGRTARDLSGEVARTVETIRVLGNGFILSALLWGSGLALIVDRRLLAAASVFAIASLATLCGVIHSPLETGGLFWPGTIASRWPGLLAGGYGLLAALLLALVPVAATMAEPARDA